MEKTDVFGRRRLLQGAAVLGAGAALGPFGVLAQRAAGARSPMTTAGYGPLSPVRDQTTGEALISLPKGFEYVTFGRTGEPMRAGVPTPSNHDGMAAFRHGDRVHVVRNHEKGAGAAIAGAPAYNPAAAGGTTTLVFDPERAELVDSYTSLSGTMRNCAGGPTPWGTWLTCEETTDTVAGVPHGYVFEVPSDGVASGEPLKAMGRFSHEAAAVDPVNGDVYLTEDTGDSLLYRFRPNDPRDLSKGGELAAMVLEGTTDTATWRTGRSARISGWAPIDRPDPAPGQPSTRSQGRSGGAARIVRGEGAWVGNGVVYVISTSGGPAGLGQVFALDSVRGTFTSVYTSTSAEALAAPDNVCVSPRGGIVLCEDGSGTEYVHGLSADGEIFPFVRNDLNSSEWAGATFEPKNGNWLFVSLQSPGITFAITGPWRQGAL